jgi:hypothetical protein
MSQIFHIFRKDVRHFWPEILISLAMTVAFVRISIAVWPNFNHFDDPALSIVKGLLNVLVPVTWWVLSARLIHDESLVGDSQFWLTRPYQWQKLLAAKTLFLIAFLYSPLFIAQVVLLAMGGFNPLSCLPGILYNLILLTIVLVFPIVAIATVTPNFARFTLTLLGGFAYIGLILWAISSIPFLHGSNFPNPYQGVLAFALALCTFILLIGLQFATRRTWRSRWLLLALPFLLIVCSLAWPIQTLAHRLYPTLNGGEQSPVQFALDPDPTLQESHPTLPWSKQTYLVLPLTITGVPSENYLRSEAIQVSIEAPNGLRWNSDWQGIKQGFLPNTVRSLIDIPIDPKFLNRVQATPVTVTVSFALVQLRADAAVTTQAAEQGFVFPGGGICFASNLRSAFPVCRFAMSEPKLTFVTSHWSDGPCTQAPSTSGTLGDGWLGNIDPSIAEFGLDPVKITALTFSNQPRDPRHPTFICPGTPITATPYSIVRRFQNTLTLPNLDLTKYTTDHPERIAMSYSVGN